MEYFYIVFFGIISIMIIFGMCMLGVKSDKQFEETLNSRYEWPNPLEDDLDSMKTGYTSSYTFPWISTTTTQTLRKRVKKKFQRKPYYMKRKPRSEYQYIYCGDE